MSHNSYEIEVKSLLGHKKNADRLKQKMQELDNGFKEIGSHKQLNHYFIGGDMEKLKKNLSPALPDDKKQEFEHTLSHAEGAVSTRWAAKDVSVRTRWADGKVIFVLKASVDETTSSNGTARLEFESKVNMTIEELDQLLLDSGFEYQAKWSRERSEYVYKGANVSIDKNAGYGYLAEFEMIETDPANAPATKQKIREMMAEVGAEELPQDRLQRMFDFYNAHWPEYYGTDNVFTIE